MTGLSLFCQFSIPSSNLHYKPILFLSYGGCTWKTCKRCSLSTAKMKQSETHNKKQNQFVQVFFPLGKTLHSYLVHISNSSSLLLVLLVLNLHQTKSITKLKSFTWNNTLLSISNTTLPGQDTVFFPLDGCYSFFTHLSTKGSF